VVAGLVPGFEPGTTRDGVALRDWREAQAAEWRPAEVPDVVVAAFAADLPTALRRAMRLRPPVWINLEYLSAEDWVEESHGLPSPKPDGLVEHFFFPGFTERTGGLPGESGLFGERDRFAGDPLALRGWLHGIGVDPEPGEHLLSLFCYPDAPADGLLEALDASSRRWRVLLPEGVLPEWSPPARRSATVQRIRFLPQLDYDRLLWACDANFVRGEDSVVRALWAARPLVWQAYPQQGGAQLVKLRAFLRRFVAESGVAAAEAGALTRANEAWNTGLDVPQALADWLALLPEIAQASRRWAAGRTAEGRDLASRLVRFAAERL
jgi:uncharacterized repeat protein (TIGR03837 family)